jgi:hypothetical protein
MPNKIIWIKVVDETYENELTNPLIFDFKVLPHETGYVAVVHDPFIALDLETVPVSTIKEGKKWCEDYLEKYNKGSIKNHL